MRRQPDRELLPFARRTNGRVIIAYSPLAQGLLSASYDGTNTPGGVRAGNAMFLPENIERAQPLLDALREIAAAHDATPAQVALAWVIRRPNVVAIPGRQQRGPAREERGGGRPRPHRRRGRPPHRDVRGVQPNDGAVGGTAAAAGSLRTLTASRLLLSNTPRTAATKVNV